MTQQTIWQTAADLLRQQAQALHESSTVNNEWRCQVSLAAHNELIQTADELKRWSSALRHSNKLLEVDISELVELASGMALCIWGKTTTLATAQVKDHAIHLLGIYGAATNEEDQVIHPLAEVAYRVIKEAA